MKKITAILFCTVLFLSCLGCSIHNRNLIRLKGALRTETMRLEDPCQKIVIEGLYFTNGKPCEVTVTNGSVVSVETTLPADLYDDYDFTVALQNGVLRLSAAQDKRFRLNEKANIHITAPLDALEIAGGFDLFVDAADAANFHLLLEGAGDVTIEDLATEMTEIAIKGAGDVTLSGETAAFSCAIKGAGDINAKALVSNTADLSVAGAGDITLSVQDALQVDISGAGDVSYYGSPRVEKSVAGAGDVVQKSEQIPKE